MVGIGAGLIISDEPKFVVVTVRQTEVGIERYEGPK